MEAGRHLDPSDQEILNNLGFALYRHGEYAKAVSVMQSSLLLNPRRTPAWVNLSEVLARLGLEEESVQAFMVGLNFSKDRRKTIEYIDKYMSVDADTHTQNVIRSIKDRVLR